MCRNMTVSPWAPFQIKFYLGFGKKCSESARYISDDEKNQKNNQTKNKNHQKHHPACSHIVTWNFLALLQ